MTGHDTPSCGDLSVKFSLGAAWEDTRFTSVPDLAELISGVACWSPAVCAGGTPSATWFRSSAGVALRLEARSSESPDPRHIDKFLSTVNDLDASLVHRTPDAVAAVWIFDRPIDDPNELHSMIDAARDRLVMHMRQRGPGLGTGDPALVAVRAIVPVLVVAGDVCILREEPFTAEELR